MNVTIRSMRPEDQAEWLRMRRALWDDCPDEQQVREMDENLASDTDDVFFAERPGGGLCGFVEAALRSRADGCDTTPVGYIEGWYVDEDVRRHGVGRALVEAAEAWARSRGCRQMASDAELWNTISHQAHGALGYEEIGRTVQFTDRCAKGATSYTWAGGVKRLPPSDSRPRMKAFHSLTVAKVALFAQRSVRRICNSGRHMIGG